MLSLESFLISLSPTFWSSRWRLCFPEDLFSLWFWVYGDLFILDILVLQFWKSLLCYYSDNFFPTFLGFLLQKILLVHSRPFCNDPPFKKKLVFFCCASCPFCSIFREISPIVPSILFDFYCSIYVFIFQKDFLILWFLFDQSNCSFFMEVALLLKPLRILMIVSLIFFSHTKLCLFHQNNYFMFVCLFVMVFHESRATESLLKVHSPMLWTFWSISQGIVVLTPSITSCGTEIGSRLITDSFKWALIC